MLEVVFKTVLKMSITASFAALFIVPLKMLFHKISLSRKTLMILWLVIALRLICPYAPQSNSSLFNVLDKNTIHTEIYLPGQSVNVISYVHSDKAQAIYTSTYKNKKEKTNPMHLFSILWIFGILSMQGYGVFQNIRLKRKLKFSTRMYDNIYESDKITASFVSGFFKPKIYIPYAVLIEDKENMIIHEKTHITFWHNRLKVIAWIILSVHWFNPLVWLMFRLFSNDMEYVCDESTLGKVEKKSYINSIIKANICSGDNLSPDICSFSSLSKRRISNLIKYKKRDGMLHSLPSFCVCILVMLLLSTNRIESKFEPIAEKSTQIADNALKIKTQEPINNKDTEFTLSANQADEKDTIPKAEKLNSAVLPAYEPTPASKNDLSIYKSLEKSDTPYAGFQNMEPENINSEHLADELEKSNLTLVQDGADLSKSYIKGEYVSSEDGVTVQNVKCDENGNISLYISLNTDSLFDVTVYDSDTGENVFQCMVLANGENAFSLLGFDKNKNYNITLKEPTKGQWKTEGSYIIY